MFHFLERMQRRNRGAAGVMELVRDLKSAAEKAQAALKAQAAVKARGPVRGAAASAPAGSASLKPRGSA